MNTISFRLECRGHFYLAFEVGSKIQLACTLGYWCDHPDLDFDVEDADAILDDWENVPEIHKTICSWRD